MRMRAYVLVNLLAALAAVAASAAEARHVDLARYYFRSAADEAKDRPALAAMLLDLQKMRGKFAASPQSLLAALQLNDRIQRSYGRHEAYLRLRCRLDSSDGAFCSDDDALDSDVQSRTAFLATEAAPLAGKVFAQFVSREPRLAPYRYWIEDAGRNRMHLLPGAEESVLGTFAPDIAGWQYAFYDAAISGADFGSVATAHGTLDVRRQRNLLAVDPDQSVREQGFRKRYAALATVRGDVAFALLRLVAANNRLAMAHGFANAPDRKYFDLGLDPADVRATIVRVSAQGELHKRFERLRAAEVTRALKLTTAGPWDMDVPLAAIANLSLDQATALFHAAFAPLGAWYQDRFDALLGPANGRVDIVPGGAPHRSGGGFSVGYAGAQSALFVGNFDGTYRDLSVIAHEGGHAVHRGAMNDHGVPPLYTAGPNFLFESFAEFNELVLADHLAMQAPDAATRRYYDERFLAVKGLDFLAGAQDAAIEQAVYDGVVAGKVASADDIDALSLGVDRQFSIWPDGYPQLRNRWEGVSLAFEDPLYDVNYMYASLLALKYFQLYKEKPAWFLPRYRAFLQNGFDDTPQHLLKRFLDIDLEAPALLNGAVSVVDGRLKILEAQP